MQTLEALRRSSISEFLSFWLSSSVLPTEEQKTFDHYYRSYKRHFGAYVRHWYERQTQELMELIRDRKNPGLLEVGCGCGTEALWAAIQGADVTGIDISDDLLAVARARLKVIECHSKDHLRCDFQQMSVLYLDETNLFDIIFLEQTFHHLEPREKVIAKLSRLVTPRGYIILSETNGWNPLIQAFLFKLRGMKTIIQHQGHLWGHERITLPFSIVRHFRPFGLRPISLQYYRALPNIRVADYLCFVDRNLPAFFKPLFTHYNLVLQRQPSG